jgi:hypothetical protein
MPDDNIAVLQKILGVLNTGESNLDKLLSCAVIGLTSAAEFELVELQSQQTPPPVSGTQYARAAYDATLAAWGRRGSRHGGSLTGFFNEVLLNQQQMMSLLNQILTQENAMAVDLTSLTAEVANNTTVDGSIVTLINNLATQIAAIPSTDAATQTALTALVTTLQTNDAAIAAAVVANTSAAPTPSPGSAPASGQRRPGERR